jgi:DNA-binding MarR family transcriptional regulator
MHKSMVSRAVARLEQRGWVERGQSEADRREAPLRLSAAGRAVYRELVPFVLGYERAILASLSIGEQQQMAALLTKLEASLALSNRSAALGEEA